ncbi:MAG: hypothetical protein ACRYFR_17845 [Janthinobacterium lividum]
MLAGERRRGILRANAAMVDQENRPPNPLWQLAPMGGIAVFLALYAAAAALYPGGSPADKAAKGFSWQHNYWCNLLNVNAINGQPNAARPVALLAMGVLCLSLIIFWHYLPRLFDFSSFGSKIMRSAGMLSMVSAGFIFTAQHDLVLNIAGAFGLVALTGTFVGLYKTKQINLLRLGGLCVLLLAANNYVYYTNAFLYFLPVIQKTTLLIFLAWISLLDLGLYRKAQRSYQR